MSVSTDALPPPRPPTNLPAARTSFVGRAADLAALTQALDSTTRDGSRLLALTGAPGCGKIRLALAVADAVRDAYHDGGWLVELAPLPASPQESARPADRALLAGQEIGRRCVLSR